METIDVLALFEDIDKSNDLWPYKSYRCMSLEGDYVLEVDTVES
jgi:hypothetical protein